MPKMSSSEREEFLAVTGIIMNIATVDSDGAPLVTPIWFIYEEGRIWFTLITDTINDERINQKNKWFLLSAVWRL